MLAVLRRDAAYYQYFKDHHGPALIVRILASQSAHLTLQIFQVSASKAFVLAVDKFQELCNFIFDRLDTHADGELYVTPRTTVTEPALLATLLSYAELWKGSRFQYWSRLVQLSSQAVCTEVLPLVFRSFNQHALSRGQLLSQLLYVSK